MSVLIYPHNFNAAHLHFGTAIQNNDANDSKFSRIIYSTKHISFNGVGILVNLADTQQDNHYNKTFVRFDSDLPANKSAISQLQDIECDIVRTYADSDMGMKGTRRCVHSLRDQLNGGCIKAYVNDRAGENASTPHIMLKICGVWETNDEFGIIHKFIKC
jgi:hypothetical protein